MINAAVEVLQICNYEDENPGKEFLYEVITLNPDISSFILKSILSNLNTKTSRKVPTDKLFIIYECIKFLLPHTFSGKLHDIVINEVLYSLDSGKGGKSSFRNEIYTLGDLVEFKTGNHWKVGTIVKLDYKKQEYSIEYLNNTNQSTEIANFPFSFENLRKHLSVTGSVGNDTNTFTINPETINTNNIDNFSILTLENSSTLQQPELHPMKKSQLSIVELLHQFDIVSGMVKMLFTDPDSTNSNSLPANPVVSHSLSVSPFESAVVFTQATNIFEFSIAHVLCENHHCQCKLVANDQDFSCQKCKNHITCANSYTASTSNSSLLMKPWVYRWVCSEQVEEQFCTECYGYELPQLCNSPILEKSSSLHDETLQESKQFEVKKFFSMKEIMNVATEFSKLFTNGSAISSSFSSISLQKEEDDNVEESKEFLNLPAWSNVLLNYFNLEDYLKQNYLVSGEKNDDLDFNDLFRNILASGIKIFENVSFSSYFSNRFMCILSSFRKLMDLVIARNVFFKTRMMKNSMN